MNAVKLNLKGGCRPTPNINSLSQASAAPKILRNLVRRHTCNGLNATQLIGRTKRSMVTCSRKIPARSSLAFATMGNKHIAYFKGFRIVAIFGSYRRSFPILVRVFRVTEEMREVSYGFVLILGGFSCGGSFIVDDR